MERQKNILSIHKSLMNDNKKVYKFIKTSKHKIIGMTLLSIVELYKASISYELNAFIRGDIRDYNIDKEILNEISVLFSNIIHKSILSSPMRIYRIVFNNYANELCSKKNGDIMNNNGFASWSFDLQRCLEFVGTSDKNVTLMICDLQKNVPYFYIDGIRPKNTEGWIYQSEILLDKDAKFKIIKRLDPFTYYPLLDRVSKDDKTLPFNKSVNICLIRVSIIA